MDPRSPSGRVRSRHGLHADDVERAAQIAGERGQAELSSHVGEAARQEYAGPTSRGRDDVGACAVFRDSALDYAGLPGERWIPVPLPPPGPGGRRRENGGDLVTSAAE